MTKHELKAHRTMLGDSQAAFGKRLGVTGRCVRYWESGERKVPESAVISLNKLVSK